MIYMAVTADELELPLSVADTIKELATNMHTRPNNISTSLHRHRDGSKCGVKYVAVDENAVY